MHERYQTLSPEGYQILPSYDGSTIPPFPENQTLPITDNSQGFYFDTNGLSNFNPLQTEASSHANNSNLDFAASMHQEESSDFFRAQQMAVYYTASTSKDHKVDDARAESLLPYIYDEDEEGNKKLKIDYYIKETLRKNEIPSNSALVKRAREIFRERYENQK